VSTAGRLHDAIWDVLIGCDVQLGVYEPGPLANLPLDEASKIVRDVTDTAWVFVAAEMKRCEDVPSPPA
jgi:hypothetical protein